MAVVEAVLANTLAQATITRPYQQAGAMRDPAANLMQLAQPQTGSQVPSLYTCIELVIYIKSNRTV
ncbi:hypothetical protein GCM10011396_25690 [Undibacterium terreum]|uniref:Uncharacterized protein n=1 Tax=Undibacterium terreum TaxID=1224302 RepID=A0A916ULQ2_9BURK|nr:hypothetical protein GCM10011396_25690 [Undibacterium terreum]